MVNVRQPRDVAQILLSVLFLAIMIVACLWIVQPFILGFAWAGTVVIATWPVLLRLQKIMFGRRSLAVLVMTLLLVMVFIIPIALLVNSIVDGSGPLIKAISSGDMTLPDLAWLNTIPVIGAKLYAGWHNLLDMGGTAIMAKVRPYIGTTTTWFVGQAAHIGRFMVHCALMLLFSALLYWRGEQVAQGIRHFATRLAGVRGDAAVLLGNVVDELHDEDRLADACAAEQTDLAALFVHKEKEHEAFFALAHQCGAGCGGDGVSTGSAWRYRPRRIRRTLCNVANGVNDPLLPCPAWPVAGTDSGDYLALLDWRYHLGNGIVSVERCGWHAG